MGIILSDKGDLDAAIDSYKRAINIKPDYAEAYSNKGVALTKKGDLEAAIDSYKQAINIKPDHAEAYSNMGAALEKQDKLEEAIDLYKSALCQLPKVYEHPYAFYRGQMYQKIWDYDGSSVRNKQYFSQSGQDKIIHETFFKDYTSGFFLELGAYDGISGSNCLFYEKFKNWDGIAIEASETQFVKLEKNRSCKTLKAVIGERVEEVEFVEVTQGLTQMSGINYENYSRSLAIFHSNEKTEIEKRTVITKTVDSILREGMVVDFMSIDIEGNEMGVLNSIDFERYEFRVICLENNIPEKQNFNELLSKKGFCFFDRVGVDEIYYNKQYFDVFK
jgi:FkbM family methyltransferase